MLQDGKWYELYWITEYIHHLCLKFGDGVHLNNIIEVEKLAINAVYVKKERHFIGLIKYKGRFYQLIAYFNSTPKRCIIKTAYLVKEPAIIEICKQLKLK